MKTTFKESLRWSLFLVALVGLLGIAPLLGSGVALAAPASARAAAVLPIATCTLTGPAERTCELWAMTGTLSLPDGATVPIWGYADNPAGPAQLPGPALVVSQTETVHVVLHNDLAGNTALAFPGQDLVPDLVGVAPGGTVTYTFGADAPGTFSYEAGLLASGARQVAMGLYGALIVRPAGHPDWAYDDPATAFDDEALLVFSEIDPDLNNDPAGFRLQEFKADYWLLNGAAYPGTAPISTTAGSRVLLRTLNAGVDHRAVGLLGLHQTVLAMDGYPLAYPYMVVAETVAAGQSLDLLVSVPAGAAPGTRYPLYETGQHLHNSGQMLPAGNAVAFGGILTFLALPDAPPGPDTFGPLASDAQVNPSPTAGTFGVTLTATFSELDTGGADVVAAEYFTETVGAPGSGVPLAIAVPTTTVAVSAYISPATLAGLGNGPHVFYLRGQDSLGNWGPIGSAVLELVTAGPVVDRMVLTPNPTNGTHDVHIQATGDARPTGPVDVVAAEYFIDVPGTPGTGTPLALNRIAPVVSITGTVPMSTVAALAEGEHTLYVRGQDSLGNWGAFGEAILKVDLTGPGASNVVVAPSPNNGYRAVVPSIPAVRLEGRFADPVLGGVNSNLERAEGFIDTPGPDGSGFPLIASDGLFNRPDEIAYYNIPLLTIRQLDPGPHTFYVHARDVSGNWGGYGTAELIVDKVGPDVTGLNIQPNPTQGATGVLLTGTATDPANPGGAPASNLVAAEWFDGADPGAGMGHPIGAADGAFDSPTEALYQAISVIGWRPGDHVISVRGLDIAGNWGPVSTYVLTVRGQGPPNDIFSDGFESGDLAAWSAAVGAVSVIPEAAMAGTAQGMAAVVNGVTPAYAVDSTPSYEARYQASFYFHPNGTETSGGQHEILLGRDERGLTIFGLQFEHNAPGGYEVRAWARTRSGQVFTNWHEFSNAAHLLELAWESGPAAALGLSVDGTVLQRLTGLDTSNYLVDEVWLGPSSGLVDGMAGTEYFDQFNSTRGIYNTYLPLVIR